MPIGYAMMNLSHLAIFHAVAKERSISRGAERLLVSQPAVSKQLSQFERSLETRLVDRLPRGIRLTEAGEVLAAFAERIFSLELEAANALKELHGLRRGRLRIGASTTIGVYLLPEPFVRFRRENPDIDTSLDVIGSRAVEYRLIGGEIDIGFTESFSGTKELNAVTFRNDELVAIVARGHALLRKRRVTPKRFCAEPFIVRETGSESRSFVETALTKQGLTVRPVMSLASTEAIKRAVAAGIGVAIVSRNAIELEIEAGRLSVVRLVGLSIRRPLYVIRRQNADISRAADTFLKLLRAEENNR
jgi:DNA-binding transcriptional LysR family regulator